MPDKQSANAAVARWLRDVANARVHATTEEVPADRLVIEQLKLQELPAPYRGRSARTALTTPPRKPMLGYQHPLSVYDALAFGPVEHPEAIS
jgi:alkylated DNA repair dioxygenase AlkB